MGEGDGRGRRGLRCVSVVKISFDIGGVWLAVPLAFP